MATRTAGASTDRPTLRVCWFFAGEGRDPPSLRHPTYGTEVPLPVVSLAIRLSAIPSPEPATGTAVGAGGFAPGAPPAARAMPPGRPLARTAKAL